MLSASKPNRGAPGRGTDEPQAAVGPLTGLTPGERELAWSTATVLLDVTDQFGTAVTRYIYTKVPGLPSDAELVTALEAHASANAREVLTTLRAGMETRSHETPAEALTHARYLRTRGVPFQSLVAIYQYGFAVFRDLVMLELQARAGGDQEFKHLSDAFDAYSFPFVRTTLGRLAYEFGLWDGSWEPRPSDPAFADPQNLEQARSLRDGAIAARTWTASTPEQGRAHARAEQTLERFANSLEDGVRTHGLANRLALSKTSVTITLSDEPDLSVSVMFDRVPIEVLDGVNATDCRIWIASVDLDRIWSPDFFMPMAIAKGRVRIAGPTRKFLRILPILRTIGTGNPPDAAQIKL